MDELNCPDDDQLKSSTDVIDESKQDFQEGQKKKKKKRKCSCVGFSDKEIKRKKKKKMKEMSAWFREKKIWENFIRKHRKDLRNAKPVVDDKAPKLNVANIYDVEVFKNLRQSLMKSFELNLMIVKNLHEVNVFRGKTDTFKFKHERPYFSNYKQRRDEAKTIEKQNKILSKVIKGAKTRMETVKYYAEEWKRFESIVQNSSQFPLFWKEKQKQEEGAIEMSPPVPYFRQFVTEKSAKYPDKRPRVFFEVSIKNVGVVGKMIVLLYSDYVPMTVKNFLTFCDPKGNLTYKGNLFYLIFQDYYCHTGDVVENQGYGGTSIYGPYFGNEDFTLKHAERGVLTMYTKVPNRNQSQFLITFRKLESLDGQNVAFGKVIKGFHVLDAIESVGSRKTGRPKVEIYISDCDEI